VIDRSASRTHCILITYTCRRKSSPFGNEQIPNLPAPSAPVALIDPSGGRWRIRVMVAIKYRNPRHPGEAGIVLVHRPDQAQETKEQLQRLGFIIVDDEVAALPLLN
jgi:hypothetical protein